MWLCTKLGFFSIVRKAADEIHVRARCKRDLETLKAHVGSRIGRNTVRFWKIHRTEPADYRYRIVVGPVGLQGIMSTLALELDYPNFKGEIGTSMCGQRDKLSVYSAFHGDMERWQDMNENPDPWAWSEESNGPVQIEYIEPPPNAGKASASPKRR